MRPDFREWNLDGEVVFDRYLGDDTTLDTFQELLRTLAPKWCSKLRIWRSQRDQRSINIERPGALKAAVVAAAAERGPTYHKLVEQYGRPPYERLSGSAELRGAGPELVVVVSIDQMVVSPLGDGTHLGNSVSLQVARPKVEKRPGPAWLRDAFDKSCGELSPVWGAARHVPEYWAKVISDPPTIEAIGRDLGRFLPGLFWLNFFGRRYRDFIGADRLLSAPADRVATVDDGVLLSLADDPLAWDTPEYAIVEQRVRAHLGPELFFSKAEPDRPTIAPDWGI